MLDRVPQIPSSNHKPDNSASDAPLASFSESAIGEENKKPAPSSLAQRVCKWSIGNFKRQPSKAINHVSLTPSVFEVKLTIDDSKGLYGTGMGQTQKAAERLAFEALARTISLHEENMKAREKCPIEQPHQYKSFEDEHDSKQPWAAMAKRYIDSFSISHTRQPSQLSECIEWDKLFWITIRVEADPLLTGRGVHSTKRKATNLAAMQVAYQIDRMKESVKDSGRPAIRPVTLAEYSDYIVADPQECLGTPWLTTAKAELHRIFMKHFRKEPTFNVSTVPDSRPVRYLAVVQYDGDTFGRGQAFGSRESIRLSAVDLCQKLWVTNRQLFTASPLPARAAPACGTQETTGSSQDFLKVSTAPGRSKAESRAQASNSTEKLTPAKADAHKKSSGRGERPSPTGIPKRQRDAACSGAQHTDANDDSELWKSKPKRAIHAIFVKHTGRTPIYSITFTESSSEYTSTIALTYGSTMCTGKGVASTAAEASSIAAFECCKQYFKSISLGSKRSSDDDNDKGKKVLVGRSAPKSSEKSSSEVLRPISRHSEFIIWLSLHFGQPIPTLHVKPEGPDHELRWVAQLSIRISSHLAEAQGTDPCKKLAVQKCVDNLLERVHCIDRTLWMSFARQSIKDASADRAEAASSTDTDCGSPSERRLQIKEKLPEIPLVVSTEDREALQSLCGGGSQWEEAIECMRSQISFGAPPPSFRSNGAPSPPADAAYVSQKSACLLQHQEAFLSSSVGSRWLGFRASLPAYLSRRDIIAACQQAQVVFVEGAIGCGMSTQIPLCILEHMTAQGNGGTCNVAVGCSGSLQAMCLAVQVAEQRGCRLGEQIGFRASCGEDCEPELSGSILFTSDACLLRMLQENRRLPEYTHIIVDDLLCRSLVTDTVLALLAESLHTRPDLRLIVLLKEDGPQLKSMLEQHFRSRLQSTVSMQHIPSPPPVSLLEDALSMISVGGALPTQVIDDPDSMSYIESERQSMATCPLAVPLVIARALIDHLLCSTLESMLVILPSLAECLSLRRSLLMGNSPQCTLHLLHQDMHLDEAQQVVESSAAAPKLILATDCVESGFVSFPEVAFVIDCGARRMDMGSRGSVRLCTIDKASGLRRARLAHGRYFCLMGSERAKRAQECVAPQVLQLDPQTAILRQLSLLRGSDSIERLFAKLPASLAPKEIQLAVEQLKCTMLLSADGSRPTIVGDLVSRLPVPLQWGRFLIMSCLFRCLDPALVISAASVVGTPISASGGQKIDAVLFKDCSDHYGIAVAFQKWAEARTRFQSQAAEAAWCAERGLSLRVLKSIEQHRDALLAQLEKDLRLLPAIASLYGRSDDWQSVLNENTGKRSVVRGLLVFALHTDHLAISEGNPAKGLWLGPSGSYARIHPRSLAHNVDLSASPHAVLVVDDTAISDTLSVAVGVSRVPGMAAYLFSPKVDGLSVCRIDFNYRDARLLSSMHRMLQPGLLWLLQHAMAPGAARQRGPVEDEARDLALRLVQLSINLVRYHSSIE